MQEFWGNCPQPEIIGWWGIAIMAIVAMVAFLLGQILSAGPSQDEIKAAVGRGINKRIGEAGVHSRKKLPPALKAAQTAIEAEIDKLY